MLTLHGLRAVAEEKTWDLILSFIKYSNPGTAH